MGVFDFFKECIASKEKNIVALPTPVELNLQKNGLSIHEDLAELIWIGDGHFKNYDPKRRSSSFNTKNFNINISYFGPDEPSLLFTKMPISIPLPNEFIERPPYYPTYARLSVKQKGLYWKFLNTPYDNNNDIGYVLYTIMAWKGIYSKQNMKKHLI